MIDVLVVGSLNMDLVVRVPRIPAPGETLLGEGFIQLPGGKGANQAVAAGRLSQRPVAMLGRVGNDAYGSALCQSLQQAGVDARGISVDPAAATGVALIPVAASGENAIVVAPGANALLLPEHLYQFEEWFAQARCVLFQLETPLPTVACGLQLAKRHGATTLLDPAPAQPLSPELLGLVDFLTPNESEFALLAPSGDPALLHRAGVQCVVRKLGAQGASATFASSRTPVLGPGFCVAAVDTTAAGDTFNAGLAVALADGSSLAEALTFASAAAALSVTRPGAQASAPSRQEVVEFLSSAPPFLLPTA